MSDRELNAALHECLGSADRMVNAFGNVADYCNDSVWAVAMMEKHWFSARPANTKKWLVSKYSQELSRPVDVYEDSITRAVALAVLALHREGK